MMIQMNCRGFATAQFMQPEPAKYAHAPTLEAKTFMQPETQYYAHHPGRYFYIKDLDRGTLFSAPYEPVRAELDRFEFIAEQHQIRWLIESNGVRVELALCISENRPLELWSASITNIDDSSKSLSVTPYFPVGYMSWMNQGANFDTGLNAIVCRSITPYQKYSDYFKNKDLKDITFLLAERTPDSWEARQCQFEGEGGLHSPSAIKDDQLANGDASFETPTAAMQYKISLAAGQSQEFRFAFGPAKNDGDIDTIRRELFNQADGFNKELANYKSYINRGKAPLSVCTPDAGFDDFINNWLGRQIYYHGDVNRLSTDPQTRNYLQDNMGMAYIKPAVSRAAFIKAISQQNSNGAMPDGILLSEEAELKYINQVPHMDHCVWLPVCLSAYLDETNDYSILNEKVAFADSSEKKSLREHISLAMTWLFEQRDHRGLNYIKQGDWNDPMNMVGYKGKGVSGWLTLATAYASNLWADILDNLAYIEDAEQFRENAMACNSAVNEYVWSDNWYGRGITDDDTLFGIASDKEGRIYLNPQSWAILSGAATQTQQRTLIKAIEEQLETPFGVEMLAPAYTAMRDDVGRLTQKWPGVSENGSVYNHAAAFYIYALYQIQHGDKAYELLRKMIPSDDRDDILQRGQMPVFIPNYYRGAYRQYERTAGRSSQLFNTGTVHWVYRCIIDGLFGVQGCIDGMKIAPQLPNHWPSAKLTRRFRGAEFDISITRSSDINTQRTELDGIHLKDNIIRNIQSGERYSVKVLLCEQTLH